MQNVSRPKRKCADQVGNYCDDDFFPEFLATDNEPSSSDEESESSSEEDEVYDAVTEGLKYDKKRGEDCWVGRRIVKCFGEHGDFDGIVYDVFSDNKKPGYRLFAVHYFEDPDDGESMWAEELVQYVVYHCIIFILIIHDQSQFVMSFTRILLSTGGLFPRTQNLMQMLVTDTIPRKV